MNKQIYVLDEYITSTKNGIGVFITELLQCLKKMDVDICHVIFNVKQPEIRVCSKNGMKIISIPRFPSGNFFDNWKVVNRVFRLFVPDSLENVFCFNHSLVLNCWRVYATLILCPSNCMLFIIFGGLHLYLGMTVCWQIL